MEGSGLPSLSIVNSSESSTGSKADCYFYYYSSCNKGNLCPFRHEPSALRNETMCVYWLKGSCNKPHCIYRHMEITKNRNKIPCFFESQPGGCKKLHCPFFHNNVLDQPREEDVPNNPDLILPVKDSELEYETEESEIKKLQDSVAAQLKIQRKLCKSQTPFSKDKDVNPDSPTPCIIRKSFIVPLQDGESDSESVTVTPMKQSREERRFVISDKEVDWELERLKEIQKEESQLLGYTFASDDEEMLEDDNPSQLNIYDSFEEIEEEFYDDIEEDDDASHQTILRKSFLTKSSKDNLGSFAKRVIGETLMTNAKNNVGTKISRPHISENVIRNKNISNINQQKIIKSLGSVTESPKKTSVKERLGGRKFGMAQENHDDAKKNEDSVKMRINRKEYVKNRIQLNEDKGETIKNRITQLTEDKQSTMPKNDGSAVVIKSLADIKAEKERMKWSNGQAKGNYAGLLPLDAYIGNKKMVDNSARVEGIKIKTLDEIKAEKKKVYLQSSKRKVTSIKRSHSPISFDSSPPKKLKVIKKIEIENQKPSLEFKSRKLTLKRSTMKTISVSKESISALSSDKNKKTNVSVNMTSIPAVAPSNIKKTPIETGSNDNKNDYKNSSLDTLKRRTNRDTNTSPNTIHRRKSTGGSNTANTKSPKSESNQPNINRLDSFVDEEELLLLDDSINPCDDLDEEDIDEDELLL